MSGRSPGRGRAVREALTRRRRWLAERECRRQARPLPCAVIPGNLMSVSTGAKHARAICEAYLDQALERDAVVVGFTEANKVDVAAVAQARHPGVFTVIQYHPIGSPQSGIALAWRRDRAHMTGESELSLLSPKTSEGGGIRDRYALTVTLVIDQHTPHVWVHPFTIHHAPPPRAARARGRALRALARIRGTRMGDLNMRARALARIFGARVLVVGQEFLNVATERWIPTAFDRTHDVIPETALAGADHPAVVVTLWPAPPEPTHVPESRGPR